MEGEFRRRNHNYQDNCVFSNSSYSNSGGFTREVPSLSIKKWVVIIYIKIEGGDFEVISSSRDRLFYMSACANTIFYREEGGDTLSFSTPTYRCLRNNLPGG